MAPASTTRPRRRRPAACALLVAGLLAVAGALPAEAARRPVPHGFVGVMADGPVLDDDALAAAGTTVEAELDAMAAAGVESIRVAFYWGEMQPYRTAAEVPADRRAGFRDEGGVPTDTAATDRLVAAAAARGIGVLPVVLWAPPWAARQPGLFASPPADPAGYGRFVATLARRYGPRGSLWAERPGLARRPVRDWQLWNEPTLESFWLDQPFARPYVRLLRAARPRLRAVDPRARIVLAGLVHRSWTDLPRVYRAGGRRLFDAVALHPYTREVGGVLTIVRRARRVMRAHGDGRKPILLTEVSWPSARWQTPTRYGYETTERGQARRVAEALPALARARRRLGIARVFWYTRMTRETSTRYPFDYAGLRRLGERRVVVKPAMGAFSRTALRLEGCRAKGAHARRCLD